MALVPGTRIGPYEIAAQIGVGGMGEVYRATDTNLKRSVAIKVLPDALATDADRLARFQREAEVLASLNHPHIAQVYGLERSSDTQALVMELVEGETLAERTARGRIALDEALPIARQIAEALGAAHEHGIIHRDLKPANIKVRDDGTVKVLDFGLAKLAESSARGGDATISPTITSPALVTGVGTLLGTAAYMSPEQAKGKPVDQRADIYAFGAVLYEMVTGTRLHGGDSSTEVLASVIMGEPNWARVPAQIQHLLHRCLEKDPHKRLRHIGDVMELVGQGPSTPSETPPVVGSPRRWLWVGAGAVAVVAVAALVAWAPWRTEVVAPSIRFEIQPTPSMTFVTGGYPMVSPDGRWVVLPAAGTDGVTRMWLRALDSVEVRPLAGTESPNALPPPVFWSPDSRFIAFVSTPGPYAPGQLKKLDITGGPPQTICDVPGAVSGGTWSKDGVIVFSPNQRTGSMLFRVSAAGGTPTPITVVDRAKGEYAHRFPQFLPDRRRFLYLRSSSDPQGRGIYVGSIDVKPEEQSLTRIMASDRQAFYSPPSGNGLGRLLFLRDTTLFAQPFDPDRLELVGEPLPVTDQVGSFAPAQAGLFSMSQTGVLSYRVGPGGDQRQLTWFDAQGKPLGTVGEKGSYAAQRLSPDGTRVAVTQFERQSGDSSVWVLDLARGTNTKVTFNAGRSDFPVWSPNGQTLAFASNRNGRLDIYQKNADGSGEETLLWKSEEDKEPRAWSHDGRFLIYTATDPKTLTDLWVLPLEGERKPFRILGTERNEGPPVLSPDSRWIAYVSDEAGTPEVYVRPFSPEKGAETIAGGRWLISQGGGLYPVWRGNQLFYQTPALQQMVVEVRTDVTLQAGVRRPLFGATLLGSFDVSADGKRFLLVTPEDSNAPSPFIVITNWQSGLK